MTFNKPWGKTITLKKGRYHFFNTVNTKKQADDLIRREKKLDSNSDFIIRKLGSEQRITNKWKGTTRKSPVYGVFERE